MDIMVIQDEIISLKTKTGLFVVTNPTDLLLFLPLLYKAIL